MGDDKITEVEVIGKFRLLLKIRFHLDLDETFIVLSFRRKLIFISTLDKYGFSCSFENKKFSLFHNSKLVCSSYLIDTIALFNESL